MKFSDRKWFEDTVRTPLPPDQPCPYCSARGCLLPFDQYSRYLVEWDGHAQKTHTVVVPRYLCGSCGHNHAALPSCIIPYKSYSLRFLLLVLRAYFIHSRSVEQICDHYGITISMLYRWLHLFRQQKALWLGVLENGIVPPVSFLDSINGTLLNDFFLTFRFSYLELPHSTDPELLLRPPSHSGSIT